MQHVHGELYTIGITVPVPYNLITMYTGNSKPMELQYRTCYIQPYYNVHSELYTNGITVPVPCNLITMYTVNSIPMELQYLLHATF